MSMTRKKVIERLIELKALQDKHNLDDKLAQELRDLNLKNAELAAMSSKEMQDELNKTETVQEADIKGKHLNPIVDDYKQRFAGEDWYKEPEIKNGRATLTFPSVELLQDFALDQAEKNREFAVVDGKTNKVMAYSNGDGILYHGDGRPYTKGDDLSPCGQNIDDFKMPKIGEKQNRSSMTQLPEQEEKQQAGPQFSAMSETVQEPGKVLQEASFPADLDEETKEDAADLQSGIKFGK